MGRGADVQAPPDPYAEIRVRGIGALRGANYWSKRPITRLDLSIGAFEECSSAEVPGVTERLIAALPGLHEHRCSIGEPGGFITRLQRGTYVPHILEHVALELQRALGHHVGYGRTRGGDAAGEYTVVFEHRHEATGMRAAALALDVVQQAFAGTLTSAGHAIAELQMLAGTPDVPPLSPHIACAVSGGPARTALRLDIARRLNSTAGLIVEVNPAVVLHAGLPYATSDLVVLTDDPLIGIPERYQDDERRWRLLSVFADAVPRHGVVIAPAQRSAIHVSTHAIGARLAVFSGADAIRGSARRQACALAWVRGDVIHVEHGGLIVHEEARRFELAADVQAAAALAQLLHALR